MYPHERSLVKRMANSPFALIGVNSDKDREKLKEVMEEKEITWRSFWNGGSTRGPISTKWGIRGWPTLYVLDAKGVIRYKNVRGEKMDDAIETLLKEMGAEVPPPLEEEDDEEKKDKSKDKPKEDSKAKDSKQED